MDYNYRKDDIKGGGDERVKVRDGSEIQQSLRHWSGGTVCDEACDGVVDGHALALAFAFEVFAGGFIEGHSGLVRNAMLAGEVRYDGVDEGSMVVTVLNGD